jgi:hypothetical protein
VPKEGRKYNIYQGKRTKRATRMVTIEMSSGAMIYIPSFIRISSGIQKMIGGIHKHTDRIGIAYA